MFLPPPPQKSLQDRCRMGKHIVVMKLICSLRHCERDGHTVHTLSQRRLTADWLAPRESDFTDAQLRSALTGCQITSRSPDRFSRYSKWPDTFRTALVQYPPQWVSGRKHVTGNGCCTTCRFLEHCTFSWRLFVQRSRPLFISWGEHLRCYEIDSVTLTTDIQLGETARLTLEVVKCKICVLCCVLCVCVCVCVWPEL